MHGALPVAQILGKILKKTRKEIVSPGQFMRDGYGAEWVRYDLMGYWRPWFVKSNTVFYLATCFDVENVAVEAAQAAYELESNRDQR